MTVKAGNFAKSTNTSVPVSQSVTGVGFKPRVLILWTGGQTSTDSFVAGYRFGNGFAARNSSDTITVGSVAIASEDAAATSNSSKARNDKALCIVEWGESLLAECDLTSMDDDGFTLSWTTNDANAYVIHYMALAGDNITDASVVDFALATSTGDQAVTGAGFQPDCVLFLGNKLTADGTSAIASMNIGAMTSSGQWCVSCWASDDGASSTTLQHSRTSYPIHLSNSTGIADGYATYVSLDADGFTINNANAMAGAYKYFALCLKGGSYYVSSFTGSGSTGDQSVTGVGFQPEGLLLSTISAPSQTSTNSTTDLSISVSATDGTAEECALITDEHSQADMNTAAYISNSKICLGDNTANQTLNNSADIKSLDADGFTVTWDTAFAADYLYIAFAGGSISGGGGGATTTIPPIAMNYFARRGILG